MLTFVYYAAAAVVLLVALLPVVLFLMAPSPVKSKDGKTLALPPEYTGDFPLIGGLLAFINHPLNAVRKGFATHGDIFTINMLGKRMTFLIGPKAGEVFFSANDTELGQEEVYKFMTAVFGKGVVYDAPPHIRSQQFKMLGKGLKTDRLKSYVPLIMEECRKFLDEKLTGQSGEVDILDLMSEMLILTSSRCLMGKEVRENLFGQIAQLYHDLDQGIQPLSVFLPNLPTPAHRRRDAARVEMVKLFTKVIRKRRSQDDIDTSDMLGYLCTVRYKAEKGEKEGRLLTEDEITGFLIALLFAGQHTSSVTSTWSILYLLNTQKRGYLDRMCKELAQFGDQKKGGSREMNYEDTTKLEFTEACIQEGLRMYPPLILLMRYVRKSRQYGNVGIPKGDIVVTSPGASMRLNDVFKGANTFNPERWFKEKDLPRYSFIGFGGGRHACLGGAFAYLQMKCIFSVMFNTFELQPVSSDLPKPNYKAMVVGPHHGTETRVKWRRRDVSEIKQCLEKKMVSIGSIGQTLKAPEGHPSPEFTLEEVSKHNSEKDLWVIIDDLVFDITDYVAQHPGGLKILNNAGGDSTLGFKGPQHPAHVMTTIMQFYKGKVKK
mmetsp:Transcript_21064/g.29507  ORF Transcript_21064/g.29507 Transcript_21064/m.29507 type:complete len:603 (+) Transcript_21064:258-2066(+)|eukprot:CAMPEP_0184503596 /NCGR_PEP_ID=MMETSP0113_2-20130426/51986_1 /TAXON_ID=91329 /ORGANISM="Norrisiella sphaerica, Strain BC52" /LENGTH=602 /DNA_ID=CAMNT_0026893123 /DNA_START=213 /DNA_END=2021 /DNA_ORIENTATION=+